MSTSERERLPERAEALLTGWPAPSKSALDWEDAAARTVEAARAEPPEATSEDLLAAPLPAEPDEGTEAPGVAAAKDAEQKDEPGLANIARAVVAASAGTSPKDIALAGLRAADAERGDAPLAPPPVRPPSRAAVDASSVAGLMGKVRNEPGALSTRARPVPVPVAAHVPVEAAAHSEVPGPPSALAGKKRAASHAGAGAIALSLAAAFALYVGIRHAPEAATPTADAPLVTAAEPAAKGGAPHGAVAVATNAVAAEPVASVAPVVSAAPAELGRQAAVLDSLPAASEASNVLAKRPSKSTKLATSEPKELAAPVPHAKPKSLDEEMGAAVGKSQVLPAPVQQNDDNAETSRAGLPARPSVGDVQAAAGQVLMRARMCLAGQEEGSPATLTFGSDGRVKSVVISGPAAGTPAEACLKSSLSSPRVPPFSEKSFSFSLTVRPP
jgi:hypothetical protein